MRPTMCMRGKLALLVLVVACLAGAEAVHAGGGPDCDFDRLPEVTGPPLEAPFVFESIELSDGSGRRYEVRLPICGDPLCPIEVLLRDDNTVYDIMYLGECAVAQQPELAAYDAILGVGDPLRPDDGAKVWHIGYEMRSLALHARPIQLSTGWRGLLVHLIGGWDHTWRIHYLFVGQDDHLVLAWSASEVDTDDLLAVHLVDIDDDGFDEILHFYGNHHGRLEESGDWAHARVEAAVYRWNDDTNKIEGLTLTDAAVPIFAAVGGIYDTAVPAKESWWDPDSCFLLYYMLPTQYFPELAPNKFILAKFTWDRALAEKQVDACNPNGDGFVVEITQFPAVVMRARVP